MLCIAARWVDEWNIWGMFELLVYKGGVLEGYCEVFGCDFVEIHCSVIVLLFLSDDLDYLVKMWVRDHGRVIIIGMLVEVVEIVYVYVVVGVHELIVFDFTMFDLVCKRETLE